MRHNEEDFTSLNIFCKNKLCDIMNTEESNDYSSFDVNIFF